MTDRITHISILYVRTNGSVYVESQESSSRIFWQELTRRHILLTVPLDATDSITFTEGDGVVNITVWMHQPEHIIDQGNLFWQDYISLPEPVPTGHAYKIIEELQLLFPNVHVERCS